MPQCEGLSITSFDKDITRHYRKLEEKLATLMSQYSRYKNQFEKPVEFPANLKGKNLPIINLSRNNYLKTKTATSLEFRYENDVKILRIYFDTPTFDRITKDERAKFEVMLSTVGRSRYLQGVPKKRGICVQGSFLGGLMASNQKVKENRPTLLYSACIQPVYNL